VQYMTQFFIRSLQWWNVSKTTKRLGPSRTQ
jgi:hypothetical protein